MHVRGVAVASGDCFQTNKRNQKHERKLKTKVSANKKTKIRKINSQVLLNYEKNDMFV